MWYNFSAIDDYKIFPSREIKPSPVPFNFPALDKSSILSEIFNKQNTDIDSLLQENNTTAFLVIKNDTLVIEKYFNNYEDTSLSLSFSMAKSFLSILTGCAIDDGYIKSIEQPVTDFVPELATAGYDKVKIKHLLQMTSGMDYTESDSPFTSHPYYYYGDCLEEKLLSLKLKNKPGEKFEYKSGEPQLIGLILKRALKTKTITEYMQERLWNPLGMEYGGLWSIDSENDGFEKVFCCLSARAKDYAKFGMLYLNYGNWNGKQIIPKQWVEESTRIDTTEGSVWNYQYLWWIVSKEEHDYTAIGHLGQYLYINPQRNIIIVRLGKSSGDFEREDWLDLFSFISKTY